VPRHSATTGVSAADSKKIEMSDELLELEADVSVNLIRPLANHVTAAK
jgi:hypothetical protein